MISAQDVQKALAQKSSLEKAEKTKRFFKTGKGEYSEKDVFIGVTMPEQRAIAKAHQTLSLPEIEILLQSKIHEHRLTALIILTLQFPTNKKAVYDFYINHRTHINNWDLVDVSTPKIVGAYLLDNKRDILYTLAQGTLWEKRIAIVATYTLMKAGEEKDILQLAKQYLSETHDLTHKATGWMLRELGKNVGEKVLLDFLEQHYEKIPRTTLRYAIERFSQEQRKALLKGIF